MSVYKPKNLTQRQRQVLQLMNSVDMASIENHSIAMTLRFYDLSAGSDEVRDGLRKCSTVCRQLISKGLLERAGWIGTYRITWSGAFDADAYKEAMTKTVNTDPNDCKTERCGL